MNVPRAQLVTVVTVGALEEKMAQAEGRSNKASLRFVRVAPRKARVVVDLIRGKRIEGSGLNVVDG